MGRFFLFLHAATAAAHIPFALGVVWALEQAGVPYAGWIALAAGVAGSVLLRGPVRLARWDRPISMWRRLGEEAYYAHWCAVVFGSLVFLLAVPVSMAVRAIAGVAVTTGALALCTYAGSLALAAWGVFVRRRWVRVRQLEVGVEGLPARFDGFRIVQLTDLHIGSHCPRERALSWVRRANALAPDLVALTGDYVTSGTRFHEDIADVLGRLRATEGVFAVMGNHDYFGDGEPLATLLAERGVRVLRNERTAIERDGALLALAGVDDTWTRRTNVARALDGYDGSAPLVALAHDPKLFPALAKRGAALVLSGHTHGGQVGVPFFATKLNLAAIGTRLSSGLYKSGSSAMYVSAGLGTTGPPVRLGAAPEIAVLVLRAAGATR